MAKKDVEDDEAELEPEPEPEPKPEPEKPKAKKVEAKDPSRFVILDGEYSLLPVGAKPKDRVIVVGNSHYEHTHEDANGVWGYRRM